MTERENFNKTGLICLAVFAIGTALDIFTNIETFTGAIGLFMQIIGFAGIAFWVSMHYLTIKKYNERCEQAIWYMVFGFVLYFIEKIVDAPGLSFFAAVFIIGNMVALLICGICSFMEHESEIDTIAKQKEEENKDKDNNSNNMTNIL